MLNRLINQCCWYSQRARRRSSVNPAAATWTEQGAVREGGTDQMKKTCLNSIHAIESGLRMPMQRVDGCPRVMAAAQVLTRRLRLRQGVRAPPIPARAVPNNRRSGTFHPTARSLGRVTTQDNTHTNDVKANVRPSKQTTTSLVAKNRAHQASRRCYHQQFATPKSNLDG